MTAKTSEILDRIRAAARPSSADLVETILLAINLADSRDLKTAAGPQPVTDAGPAILRRRDVERQLGISRSTIYDWMNPRSRWYKPDFPKPIRIGGSASVGWIRTEIDAWVIAHVQDRGRPLKDPAARP